MTKKKENIVIFGGGLHSNVCIDILEASEKYTIVGIIDSLAEIGSYSSGYEIIGRQEDIVLLSKKYNLRGGFIAIGDNYSRKYVRDEIVARMPDFNFVNAIHHTAIIGRNAKIGNGVLMMAGVIVNAQSVVEDFCILNTGAQLGHDSKMGEFSLLSSGSITGGKVIIKRFAAITLGVTIIDRLTIGENTVVGSGSTVLNDLPNNVLAYGSPAKSIRSREPKERFLKSG